MNKDDTVFSYEEAFGLHVNKVRFSKNPYLLLNGGDGGNFHFVTEAQSAMVKTLESKGYKVFNGYEVTGKDFVNPEHKEIGHRHKAPHFERDIVVMAVPLHNGCIAVYPSGAQEKHASKSWKPGVEHFRK